MREFIYCTKAGCRTRADTATGYCPQHRAASADTHPKDGNSTEIEVPLVSGAVPEGQTPKGGSHA